MKNELRAKILEMTLAAFGASACASTQAADPAKVPSAAEVTKQSPASHGEASCSAAGCGAKAEDGAPSAPSTSGANAAPASDAKDALGAATIAPPVAEKDEATASDQPASVLPAKAKPASSKPKHKKKKAANDEGCGAGSCASSM